MSVGVAIASIVLAVTSFVVSLVLSSKAKDALNNIPAESGSLGDFSATQMKEGVVVPIIYGTQFVKGNLTFWAAEKINNEYYAFTMLQVIGMGKLTLYRPYKEGVSPDGGGFPQSPSVLAEAGYMSQWLIGRDLDRNVLSMFNYYDGASTFSNSDYYTHFHNGMINRLKAKMPDNGQYWSKIKGVANIFTDWVSLPQGVTTIPSYNFIVRKMFTDDDNLPIGVGNLTGSGQIYNLDNNVCGSNPAFVIYDLLTNINYGLGIPETKINLLNFQQAASYFEEKKYGLNFTIASISSVRDIINQIQLWINCYLIKNDDDEYIIKILKASDADSPAAVITDADEVAFKLRRGSWSETYNSYTANYTDCFVKFENPLDDWEERLLDLPVYTDGSIRSITVKNEANISLTGSVRHKGPIDLSCFSSAVVASERLQEIMLQESYPFASGTLTTDMTFSHLRLGDVIRRDSNEYNISGLFRIIDVGISEIDSNKIKFSIVQVKELLSLSTAVQHGNTRGVLTNADTPSGLENIIFSRFSDVSEPLHMSIHDKTNLVAVWGSGQFQSGYLLYGSDFTIDKENRVKLDSTLFADDIMNNTSSLMNIDIYEKDLPEES